MLETIPMNFSFGRESSSFSSCNEQHCAFQKEQLISGKNMSYLNENMNCKSLFSNNFFGLLYPESLQYISLLRICNSLFSDEISPVISPESEFQDSTPKNEQPNVWRDGDIHEIIYANIHGSSTQEIAHPAIHNSGLPLHVRSYQQNYTSPSSGSTGVSNNNSRTPASKMNVASYILSDRSGKEYTFQEESTAPANIEIPKIEKFTKEGRQGNAISPRSVQCSPHSNPSSPSSPRKSKGEDKKVKKPLCTVTKKILQTEKREARKLMRRYGGETSIDSLSEEEDEETKIPLVRVRLVNERDTDGVCKNIDMLKSLLKM